MAGPGRPEAASCSPRLASAPGNVLATAADRSGLSQPVGASSQGDPGRGAGEVLCPGLCATAEGGLGSRRRGRPAEALPHRLGHEIQQEAGEALRGAAADHPLLAHLPRAAPAPLRRRPERDVTLRRPEPLLRPHPEHAAAGPRGLCALGSAGPCHRGGRGSGHGLLHGAVHGPALHGGPVAERAGLLHAAGLAAGQQPRGLQRPGCRRQVGAGGLHLVRALSRLRRRPPAAAPGMAAGEGLRVLPAPARAEQPPSPEEGRLGPAESREAAAVDAEAVYQHLFTRIPAEHFHSPMLAFEFIQFCRDSLPLLGRNLGVLRTSFPNLFKFLAWNSPPLTSDFVALLPSLVDAGTAVEMLHLLLDLPCLTAALDLQLRSLQAASERPPWDVSVRAPGCLEAFRDSQVQGLFQHLLRAQASGTAERLTPLYRLLQPLAGCARVVQCAEAVPTLLRAFFSAVTQFANGALASQLALLLLERSDSLYQVPGYEAAVHRVLGSQFPALCKLHPPLVVEQAKELLEFVGGPRGGGHVLTSVVWAIGEYLSVSWDRRCTVEQINNFFEALEALLFEVTQSRPSTTLPKCPPQVISVLMTTLTKLASRSQDLIPRASLLLSKMRSLAQSAAPGSACSEEDAGAVRTRATELLNLLKMPSVAQFVFTPSVAASEPRYHRDTNTALPLALRTVSRLLEREAGLLPG
nr:AP-5 complex subunit zeta-1 isoform X5 [Kogia breviceps]